MSKWEQGANGKMFSGQDPLKAGMTEAAIIKNDEAMLEAFQAKSDFEGYTIILVDGANSNVGFDPNIHADIEALKLYSDNPAHIKLIIIADAALPEKHMLRALRYTYNHIVETGTMQMSKEDRLQKVQDHKKQD